MHGALPGSSAGGEQPKFCTVREDGQPVIVKFSPAGGSAPERRWADLLVCEHLALETLNEAGVPAAKTRIISGGGRTLLEVERFDRTPRGRIGMVSLLAFDSEYIGHIDNWAATAERMSTRGLMRPSDADRLRLLEAYGQLIGNTDRHYGNISLVIDPSGSWALAPAYDTLPMIYAPVAGELVSREDFDPGKLAPTADTLRVWDAARKLAIAFWRSVAAEKRISSAFRRRPGGTRAAWRRMNNRSSPARASRSLSGNGRVDSGSATLSRVSRPRIAAGCPASPKDLPVGTGVSPSTRWIGCPGR